MAYSLTSLHSGASDADMLLPTIDDVIKNNG
jgi:hypothetical protein